MWLKFFKPKTKILDFPDLMQIYLYDCGATAIQAMLAYYGINIRESQILKDLKATPRYGTSSTNVVNILNKQGLKCDIKNMTVADLINYIDKDIPVIILIQAWDGTHKKYDEDYNNGHWVVMIGYDHDKIIFEDPFTFQYSYLTRAELETRWHGQENGQKIKNYGIAVYGKKPVFNSQKMVHMD